MSPERAAPKQLDHAGFPLSDLATEDTSAAPRREIEPGFVVLVRKYRPALARLARRHAGTAEDAEDLLQESLLDAYRGFHRFIPTLLKMRGYRVIEVPVGHRPRQFGRWKYGVLNRAVVAFVDLLVIRWMGARLLRYEIVEDVGGDLIRD